MRVLGRFKINSSGISWKIGSSSKESLESDKARERFRLLEWKVCKCSDWKSGYLCDSNGNS